MKNLLLLLFIISFSCKLSAQNQILFQSENTKSYLIHYQNSMDENQKVVNEMIETIGKFIPKPPASTKFTLSVEENVKVLKNQNTVKILVDFNKVVLMGDITYKGFDMSDVLIPSKYEFTGSLFKNRNQLIADFTQPKTAFNFLYNETVLQYTDTTTSSSYSFTINTFKYYYDFAALKHFRDKASFVDEYYFADNDLKMISKLLSEINPNAYEKIDGTQKDLNEIKKKILNISDAAFWQILQIEKHDPVNLFFKLSEQKKVLTELENQLNYTLSVAHQLYYNKGLEYYVSKKFSEATNAFEKSLKYEPNYAPSLLYLLRIDFDLKKYKESKERTIRLYTLKNIDDNTMQMVESVAKALEWTDLNVAAEYLNQNKYQDAIDAANQAEEFCKSLKNYQCNDTIELIKKDCHNGIYNDIIKTAQNYFSQKKIDKSEIELNKAFDYQSKYKNYITPNPTCDDLFEKIKIEQYYLAIAKGKEEMNVANYRNAFNEFNKASGLEKLYPVKKDKQLPSLLKNSKAEVLYLILLESENAIAANNLKQARNLLKQVIDEQVAFGLMDNSKLNTKIETLKKGIFSQECNNAQKDYDNKILSAESQIKEKFFIEAESSYHDALKIVSSFNDCGINGDAAVLGLKNIEKSASYQKKLRESADYAKNYNYNKAIDSYNQLVVFYNKNSSELQAITHKNLNQWINEFEYGFLLYGITWYCSNNDPDNGLILLKNVRQRNVNKAFCKNHQITLARVVAIRDYNNGNMTNAKIKVLDYTLGDKWYNVFTAEYIKQIKRMK